MSGTSRSRNWPVALTIAGSDSDGGAGIQADLKVFAALGVHGATVITAVTAQNPRRVIGVQGVRPDMVRRQIAAVLEELPPAAVKTGMLFSSDVIRVVAEMFSGRKRPPLVIDPVIVSTSGRSLLSSSGIKVLQQRLLPLAALVTPNVPEAQALTGRRIASLGDLHAAARQIHERFGCAVLAKGGHLRKTPAAIDIFYDGRGSELIIAPMVEGISTHGTGCALSAAIAALLARGHGMSESACLAKEFINRAIRDSYRAGGHPMLSFGFPPLK